MVRLHGRDPFGWLPPPKKINWVAVDAGSAVGLPPPSGRAVGPPCPSGRKACLEVQDSDRRSRPSRPAACGVLLSGLLILPVGGAGAQERSEDGYLEIARLGTSTRVCSGIANAHQLKEFFASEMEIVREILEDAGFDGDPGELAAAVEAGQFTERTFPMGFEMQWMGIRKDGRGQAVPKVRFAGLEGLAGFLVSYRAGCTDYQFVVPSECCNVALIRRHEVRCPASPSLTFEAAGRYAGMPARPRVSLWMPG